MAVLRSEADFTDPHLSRERRRLALYLLVHLVDGHGRLSTAYRRVLKRAAADPRHWAHGRSLGSVRAEVARWIGVAARSDCRPPWDRIADLVEAAVDPRDVPEVLATARYLHCRATGEPVPDGVRLRCPDWIGSGAAEVTTALIGGPEWARRHRLAKPDPIQLEAVPAGTAAAGVPVAGVSVAGVSAAGALAAGKPAAGTAAAGTPTAGALAAGTTAAGARAAGTPAAATPAAATPAAGTPAPQPAPARPARPRPEPAEARSEPHPDPAAPQPRVVELRVTTPDAPKQPSRPKHEQSAYELLWSVVRVHREAEERHLARTAELEAEVAALRAENARLTGDVTSWLGDYRPGIPAQRRPAVTSRHLALEDASKAFTYPLPAELPETRG